MIKSKTTTQKLPMSGNVKKGFRIYVAAILAFALIMACGVTAFAAAWDSQGCYRMNGSGILDDTMAFQFDKAERLDRVDSQI